MTHEPWAGGHNYPPFEAISPKHALAPGSLPLSSLLWTLLLCPPWSRGWLFLERWLISLEPVVWGSPLANYNRAWRVYFSAKMETGPTLGVILNPLQVSAGAFNKWPSFHPLTSGACVAWPLLSPASSLAAFPELRLKENTVSVCTQHIRVSWATWASQRPQQHTQSPHHCEDTKPGTQQSNIRFWWLPCRQAILHQWWASHSATPGSSAPGTYYWLCCCLVTKLCRTLCDPMHCSSPGSSNNGIFQARVLEWGAVSFSWGSSPPRDRTHRWTLYHWNTWEAHYWL